MSDNWVVQNLENALETWNEKLSEIWTLITTTPQNFKALCPFCIGERCYHIRNGAYACII